MSSTKHGMHRSPEYRIWKEMRRRCNNPNAANYKYYGARGIKVCERWDDFAAFYEDMGPRPSPDHSIDREDNDVGYSPDNCRWATREQQAQNRRGSDISGETFAFLTVMGRSERAPVNGNTFWLCRCVCGKITTVRRSSLKASEIQSCGCQRHAA